MLVKLKEVEPIINVLNPILSGDCNGLLALDLMDVLDELEPQLEKLTKIRTKMIETYAEKDEKGEYVLTKNPQGLDVHVFGENEEKVNEELEAVLDQEVELKNQVDVKNLNNDVKVKPIGLKFLLDKGILKK